MNLQIQTNPNSIYAIFIEQYDLDKTISVLKSLNFKNTDISILINSNQPKADLTDEKNNRSPEVATAGAASGALAGGIMGWLVGAGTLAIPGLGAFIAAGPIMSAIAGAGIGGTVGGLTGGLIGLGIPENEAKNYEDYIRNGGKLISIEFSDNIWKRKAIEILEENGAKNIYATSNETKENENSFYDELKFEHDLDERRNNPHA